MAAITNPGNNATEFSGEYKLISFYDLDLTSSSETLTLTYADNKVSEIQNVVACVNDGTDSAFQSVNAQFSGLVITIESSAAAGTYATDFTGTSCNLIAICK